MWRKLFLRFCELIPAAVVQAHCDGPCGVYDPAASRIAAEAVLSMTKKILALKVPTGPDPGEQIAYHNTLSRYVVIKEEQAELAKRELLILWTDYFKPEHLTQFPDLHTKFWQASKLASACKQEVSLEHAQELLEKIKVIHEMFWKTKGKDVAWYIAS